MLYKVLIFFANIIIRFLFKIEVVGYENIPENGKVILSPNHLSNWDPFIISIISKRQIYWMGKKELFNNKILGSFLGALGVFPVDRDGVDIKAVKTALKILKEDKILGIFPEGTRVDSFDLRNAKPGALMFAIKSKTPVVPIMIDTDYKFFKKVKVTIGEPINYWERIEGKADSSDYKKCAEHLLTTIYDMGNNNKL